MKHLHFIHALVITPFEQAILGQNANNWLYIANQDYCVHVLYCVEKDAILFQGTRLVTDTEKQIEYFLNGLTSMHTKVDVKHQIVTLAFGEDEMDNETVAKYLRK